MSTEHSPARFGRIPAAKRRSGLSRSTLYKIAAEYKGVFLKAGAATIVDFERLDEVLAELPAADLKAPGAGKAA